MTPTMALWSRMEHEKNPVTKVFWEPFFHSADDVE